MILYKNTKAIVRSRDRDTDLFNIVAGVLARRYISTIYVYKLPRLRISNVKNKQKCFHIKKDNRRHSAETMTDADYAALLTNTPN